MGYHTLAFRTIAAFTTDAPLFLLVGSASRNIKLLEMGIASAATGIGTCTIGLGRPSSVAVGAPTATATLIGDDVNDAPVVTMLTPPWGTSAPGAPTNYLRRTTFTTNAGERLWTFPNGIILSSVSGVSQQLLMQVITGTTSRTFDVHIVFEEE